MRNAIEEAGPGTVESIYVAAAEGAPMRAVDTIVAVPGGLRGDRYLEGTGHWSRFGRVCEVTFIAAEDLEAIGHEAGVRVLHGEHRRNVVTRGLDPAALRGARLRIGGATFEIVGPRSVCRYVERITEPGMTDALRGRGGLCARVVDGGAFAVGDAVRLVDRERTAR